MNTHKSDKLGKVTIPDNEEIDDFENPEFIFTTTPTSLLSRIVKGEIDPFQLARNQLINRGQNENGEWVGFERAYKLFFPLKYGNSEKTQLKKRTAAQLFIEKAKEIMPQHSELQDLSETLDDFDDIDDIFFQHNEYLGGMATTIIALIKKS